MGTHSDYWIATHRISMICGPLRWDVTCACVDVFGVPGVTVLGLLG